MHGTSYDHDVIVVGARCAGAATAMLLARAGLDVAVFDHAVAGTDTLSTHALMRAGVLQLSRWGLLDEVVAAGTPAVRRTVFHYASESTVVSIKPTAGIDALYAPRRTVLDPVLVAAARDAGATVSFGTAIDSLLRDDRGRVTGVRVRDGRGTRDVRAGLVVGADGRHSFVARDTGAPFEHLAPATSTVVYAYWSGIEVTGYEWYYRDGFSAGCIPTNDGAVCVFTATSPDRIAAVGGARTLRDRHDDLVRAHAPDLVERTAGAVGPTGLHVFSGQRGWLRRSYGDGWALVGDAASFKDPITAHGITDALRDAELLARVIEQGLGTTDEQAQLAAYQAERDRLSLPHFAIAGAIAAYDWDDDAIHALLLQLNSSMALEVEALLALEPRRPTVVVAPT